jgi:carnosine N-methyltransferase
MGGPFRFLDRFQDIEDAIDTNANCALDILRTGLQWGGFENLLDVAKGTPKYADAEVERLAFAPHETTDEHLAEWSKPNLPRVPGLDRRDNQKPHGDDLGKAASTIRHLYREWSKEGDRERNACFGPIINFIIQHFREIPQYEWHKIKILNPGCGLGRLVFDLATLGFQAEGCEISYHMLITSMHMLNAVKQLEQYRIHPWVLSSSNHSTHANRMRHVLVPDVIPSGVMGEATELLQKLAHKECGDGAPDVPEDRLGIASGDFCTVYKGVEYRETYDVVATAFFLDTAKNSLTYMEAVANCLKANGIWVNHGPLKWHFEAPELNNSTPKADNGTRPDTPSTIEDDWSDETDLGIGEPGSVELMEEDILELIKLYGFKMIHYDGSTKTRGMGYIWDEESFETNVYFPSFWVAQKIGEPEVEVGNMPYQKSSNSSRPPRRTGRPLNTQVKSKEESE